jgi:hypothetical protein
MADVHVVITNKGNVDDIIVMPEQLPVLDEDFIFWHVSSDHPRVDAVEIAFEGNDALFFEFKDASGVIQEEPIYRKELASRNDPDNAGEQARQSAGGIRLKKSILITGKAPRFGEDIKRNKYTVRALARDGNEVAREDPVIITTRPRP